MHRFGFDMTRHMVCHKAEVRFELWTAADGETLEHAELYRFGELVDEAHYDHDLIAEKAYAWIHE